MPGPGPLVREPPPVPDGRDGAGAGERSPDEDGDARWPVMAAPTVVPCPPPNRLPAATSYVVIPAMVTPKTSAAASTERRHPLTRARWTVPGVNSPGDKAEAGARGADAVAGTGPPMVAAPRNCSPVRRKRCWRTGPPHAATALTTPAPRIVP
ncbi:hypothetical protein [Streptomyces naganishii]|uniref:hypothetical protein n=1 Tax=Streptomyces naganishii TaxID=285447 RepID=UPI00167D4A79|nr:hypothetical protein [Streptomyces naganishii]